MKSKRWLKICLGLALAGLMVWTVPVFAQGRNQGQWGPGNGPCGQGMGWGQGQQGQGPGPGYGNCPNNNQYQNCPNYSGNTQGNMGRRGPRGAGRNYQPNTQNYNPPVTQ